MKPKSTLSNNPQQINEHTWYYEEPKGVLVVHEVREKSGAFIQTETILIPWSCLRRSLGRKDGVRK